jgi:HAD superfamily hydrolase (TIGR01509 family)
VTGAAPGPVAGVLFDVGYCLLDESRRLGRALDWLAARLAAGGRALGPDRLLAAYHAACRAPDPGEPSLLAQCLTSAGVPGAEAARLRRELPWDAAPLEPYPGAGAVLRALRAAGLRVGVLANQPPSARTDLERAGLAGVCDGIWLSGEAGLAKPDPAFFRLALAAWALPPARVAYVGDRPDHDVAPARALGLFTVRVLTGPHATQPARGAGQQADRVAASLEAVPGCLPVTAR